MRRTNFAEWREVGCAVLVGLVVGPVLIVVAAYVFWAGPGFWVDIIREQRWRLW